MKQPMLEQQGAFWKWCGFRYERQNASMSAWIYPDGQIKMSTPNLDLINIVNYAVTKLQNEGYQVDIICHEHKGYKVIISKASDGELSARVSDSGDDLSLVLFWAIWEVVK